MKTALHIFFAFFAGFLANISMQGLEVIDDINRALFLIAITWAILAWLIELNFEPKPEPKKKPAARKEQATPTAHQQIIKLKKLVAEIE